MYYLDYNKKENCFVINKSMDSMELYKIPKGLMNPENGKEIQLVGKKFKWESNTKIRVINNDGIEKTVDVSNNCD